MDNEQGLPNQIPTFSLDLIKQLDRLNPQAVVDEPITADQCPTINFLAGRRSLVDELIRIADVKADN